MQAQVDLETNTQNNIVKVITEKIKAKSRLDVELVKRFTAAMQQPTHEARMGGYAAVLTDLDGEEPMAPAPPTINPQETLHA